MHLSSDHVISTERERPVSYCFSFLILVQCVPVPRMPHSLVLLLLFTVYFEAEHKILIAEIFVENEQKYPLLADFAEDFLPTRKELLFRFFPYSVCQRSSF